MHVQKFFTKSGVQKTCSNKNETPKNKGVYCVFGALIYLYILPLCRVSVNKRKEQKYTKM
jgi:hypothetical protein